MPEKKRSKTSTDVRRIGLCNSIVKRRLKATMPHVVVRHKPGMSVDGRVCGKRVKERSINKDALSVVVLELEFLLNKILDAVNRQFPDASVLKSSNVYDAIMRSPELSDILDRSKIIVDCGLSRDAYIPVDVIDRMKESAIESMSTQVPGQDEDKDEKCATSNMPSESMPHGHSGVTKRKHKKKRNSFHVYDEMKLSHTKFKYIPTTVCRRLLDSVPGMKTVSMNDQCRRALFRWVHIATISAISRAVRNTHIAVSGDRKWECKRKCGMTINRHEYEHALRQCVHTREIASTI